jgi:hypothetical protein
LIERVHIAGVARSEPAGHDRVASFWHAYSDSPAASRAWVGREAIRSS